MKSVCLTLLILVYTFKVHSQSCRIELVKIGTKKAYGRLIEDESVPRVKVNGTVYVGEYCKVLIINNSETTKYFSVLDFQPDSIINLVVPNSRGKRKAVDYKINPGDTKELGEYDIIGYSPPYGHETFLGIFSDKPLDFSLSKNPLNKNSLAISREDLYWMLEGKSIVEHPDLVFFRYDFEIRPDEGKVDTSNLDNTILKRSQVPAELMYVKYPILTFINPPEGNYDTRGAQLKNPKTKSKSMVVKGNLACLDSIKKVEITSYSNSSNQESKYSVNNFTNAIQTVFFEKQIDLFEGTNKINVNVVSKKGYAVSEQLVVDFEPDKSTQVKGKDVVLLLAVNDYKYWPKLKNPVSDANAFKEILISHYGFDELNIISLFNEKFNSKSVDSLFRLLIRTLNPNDRLLVYYAGHGMYDSMISEGYWIPFNGEANATETYLTNSTISKYIKSLKTKHVLFIADACFSGGYLTSEGRGAETYFDRLDHQKSRWVFASGGMEEVADDYKGKGHSPFSWYLMEYLKQPINPEFSVSELSVFVSKSVANNTRQKPIARPVQDAGDEGGEFIFKYR